MYKIFIITFLLIQNSVYGSQYESEIEALLFLMRYQNKNEIIKDTRKEYLSIPINKCISIIEVKSNQILKSYKVNICEKKIS